jgi:hypothetical protein
MTTTQKILVNGEEKEIPAAPITLLCHHGAERIDVPDAMLIGPMQTMARAAELTEDEWRQVKASPGMMRLFRMVFPDITLPEHSLQQHGSGVQHVVGLILLTIEAIMEGKRYFWQLPETYLHPASQVGLADLMIDFARIGRTDEAKRAQGESAEQGAA